MSALTPGSQPTLATYPRVLRRHAKIWTVLLPGAALFGWFALPTLIRAQFTGLQVATLVFFLAVMLGIVWVLAGGWVKAGPEGLRFRNGLVKHHVPWRDVEGIRFWPGDAWAFVELDGTDRPLLGIQRSDGRPALKDVEYLRELLAYYRAEDAGPSAPPED